VRFGSSRRPNADFNVKFAALLFGPQIVPGEKRKNSRKLSMSGVTHDECIGSVSEAPRKPDFRASPTARRLSLGDAEMQGALFIRPGIRRNETRIPFHRGNSQR
jgi:hypothetical protein